MPARITGDHEGRPYESSLGTHNPLYTLPGAATRIGESGENPMPDKSKEPRVAHLVRINGPLAGSTHAIDEDVLKVGRAPENHLLPDGDNAGIVSARHLEIRKTEAGFELVDLGSTNGTLVDGQQVEAVLLKQGMNIILGADGPGFEFRLGPPPRAEVRETKVLDLSDGRSEKVPETESPVDEEHEKLLQDAVEKARSARRSGHSGQTMMHMRAAMVEVIDRSSRKFKIVIAALIVALAGVSGWAAWRIRTLGTEMDGVDGRIGQIELELENAADPARVQTLIQELSSYQKRALAIEKSLLYQLGARSEEQDFIEEEIRVLMAELGAEQYSIPPEFREQVEVHINRYRGPDRRNVERALVHDRDKLDRIRKHLEDQKLPADLAFMVLVETAFRMQSVSSAGAAGPWQFVPATARAYGLTVNKKVDERFDIDKSTLAACKYIRQLILDFGTGSSVMLALAAYNFGPSKIKRAIRKVEDPIRQRSFWYLYRSKSLPKETREYVPKLVAAILIGRNPVRFGFG